MNQANNPNQGRQQKPDQPNQQPGQGSQNSRSSNIQHSPTFHKRPEVPVGVDHYADDGDEWYL